MASVEAAARLAVNGGPKVRAEPWPERGLFGAEEKAAVDALFDECIRTGKPIVYQQEQEEAYCKEFADSLGGGYADAVSSGTAAVYVALRALEIEPYTEVIVPPITDVGGVMPVALMNCIPVVADSAPGFFNVGPDQIEERITDLTSAIIVAHIAGIPADMGPIMEVARSKGIPVIEDCAQAHGAKYRGRPVGTFGDFGVFSTMFGKHHATAGQGGLVFTKSEELYWRARRAADRGKPFNIEGATGNVICSLNFNTDELRACVGRVQLKKLPAMVEKRRRLVEMLAERCRDLKAAELVTGPAETEPSYWFLFFRFHPEAVTVDKETFVEALKAEGLPFEPSYTRPWVDMTWYKERAVFGRSGLPWSSPQYKGDPDREYPIPNLRAAHAGHFRFFFHESLTERDLDDVVAALRKVERAYAR